MPTPAKKRTRRKTVPAYQSYIFRVEGWEPSYSFSLYQSRITGGPYSEHFSLALTGVFLSPVKLKDRRAVLTIDASRRKVRALAEPEQERSEPLGVGSLSIRGDQIDYLGSVPLDALWGLAGLLAAGKIGMLDLHGRALYRGKAMIETIHFASDIDPENW